MKREKKKVNKKLQWLKFIIVLVLYLLFLYWVKSWLGLLVVPFIYDAYISKKIKWKWWQDREGPIRTVMSWVDAIVFALYGEASSSANKKDGVILQSQYTGYDITEHHGLLHQLEEQADDTGSNH